MAKRLTDREIRKRTIGPNKWVVFLGCELHNVWEYPGVYVIYLDGLLSYVGQSNTPRFRFRQHGLRDGIEGYPTPWGVFKDMYVKIKYPAKYGMEAMIEKRIIRKLKPRFNVYLNKSRKMESSIF